VVQLREPADCVTDCSRVCAALAFCNVKVCVYVLSAGWLTICCGCWADVFGGCMVEATAACDLHCLSFFLAQRPTSQLWPRPCVMFVCCPRTSPNETWCKASKHKPGVAYGPGWAFGTDAALQKTSLCPAWHVAYLLRICPYVSVFTAQHYEQVRLLPARIL
jgi:hypothetical protein